MLNISCNIRVGLGIGADAKEVQGGDTRKGEAPDQAVAQGVCEPVVDVFEEEDHTLIVAEMPGIGADDIRTGLKGDVLTLYAARGQKRYRKEVPLSGGVEPERVAVSYHNGVAEIRCLRPRAGGQGDRS